MHTHKNVVPFCCFYSPLRPSSGEPLDHPRRLREEATYVSCRRFGRSATLLKMLAPVVHPSQILRCSLQEFRSRFPSDASEAFGRLVAKQDVWERVEVKSNRIQFAVA